MRKITRISLALGTSAALLSLSALPASAADDGGPVPPVAGSDKAAVSPTIEVDDGVLSISVVGDVAAGMPFKPGKTAEILIPAFTVTDERAGIADWTVGVTVTDFKSDNAAESDAIIPVTQASYAAGEPESKGVVRVAGTQGFFVFGADGRGTALTATGVKGNNTATWNSTLSVKVPEAALAGTYTAMLTHSFL